MQSALIFFYFQALLGLFWAMCKPQAFFSKIEREFYGLSRVLKAALTQPSVQQLSVRKPLVLFSFSSVHQDYKSLYQWGIDDRIFTGSGILCAIICRSQC